MGPRDQSEELALAIELGVADVADAVRWADEQIEASSAPHLSLLELSMSGRAPRPDVAHLLRQYPGTFDPELVARGVIARMHRRVEAGTLSPRRAAEALYWMHTTNRIPEVLDLVEAASLAEAFELARLGICGTEAEAERHVRGVIKRFA